MRRRDFLLMLGLEILVGLLATSARAAEQEPAARKKTLFCWSASAKVLDKQTREVGFRGELVLRNGAHVQLVGGEGTCFLEPGAMVSSVGGTWAFVVKKGGDIDRQTGGDIHIYAEMGAALPRRSNGSTRTEIFEEIALAPLRPYTLKGTVRNAKGETRSGIKVLAYALNGKVLAQTATDAKGDFAFQLASQVRSLAAYPGQVWHKYPSFYQEFAVEEMEQLRTLHGWETAFQDGFWSQDASVTLAPPSQDRIALSVPLRLMDHELPVREMAFAADSATLVTVSLAAKPISWNVKTGERLHKIIPPRRTPWNFQLAMHDHGPQWALAVDPAGKFMAFAAPEIDWGLWDLRSGERLRRLDEEGTGVHCAAFSADGRTLVIGGNDGINRLGETTGGQGRSLVSPQRIYESSFAFSPDDKLLLSSGNALADNGRAFLENTHRVRIWDVATGRLARTLEDGVSSVRFSTDGKRFVGYGFHQVTERSPTTYRSYPEYHVLVWDRESGRRLMRVLEKAETAAFTRDGFLLLTAAGNSLHLWEVDSGQEVLTCLLPQKGVCKVLLSAEGRKLAVGKQDGAIYLWDIPAHRLLVPNRKCPAKRKRPNYGPISLRARRRPLTTPWRYCFVIRRRPQRF